MTQTTGPLPGRQDFGALVGYDIQVPEPGMAEIELVLAQHHCNRLGTVHGGVLMTLLDTAGMWACTEGGKTPPCPTVSLSCNFIRAASIANAKRLRARGTLTRKGRNLCFVSAEVYAGEALVATAQGVYAAAAPRPV